MAGPRTMLRKPRHRPSSIDRLGDEIVREINRLKMDECKTLDEILAYLQAMGVKEVPSRSALGRHTRSLEEVAAEMRKAESYAAALFPEGAKANATNLAALNYQLGQANLFRVLTAAEDGVSVTLSPEDSMFVARAMAQFEASRKSDLETRRKEKEEVQREVLKAVDAVAATKGSGMTKATVDAIYAKVLGAE